VLVSPIQVCLKWLGIDLEKQLPLADERAIAIFLFHEIAGNLGLLTKPSTLPIHSRYSGSQLHKVSRDTSASRFPAPFQLGNPPSCARKHSHQRLM